MKNTIKTGVVPKFAQMKIIDSHVHIFKSEDKISKLMYIADTFNIDKLNVLSLSAWGGEYLTENLICTMFKSIFPGRIYAYASLVYPESGVPDIDNDFVEQAKRYVSLGMDGIKMLEGKPNIRKRIGTGLDSPVYDKLFSYLEEEKIPIIYHVADPKVLWDKDNVPNWAISNGWVYTDGSYVSKEKLYEEAEGIMRKFPELKVTFAHFNFMDEEGIERSSEFLDRWPGVSFDLTPGGGMYDNFSKDPDRWRDFFIKYQDRIIFGTDNDWGASLDIIYGVRSFLEMEGESYLYSNKIKCFGLRKEILEKIYYKNFEAYAGSVPKKLNPEAVSEECDIMLKICSEWGDKHNLSQQILKIKDKILNA